MVNKNMIIEAGNKSLKVALKLAIYKQKIVEEAFKMIKTAAIATDKKIDDDKIVKKIYNEVKAIDNETIKKILDLESHKQREQENKIIEQVVKKCEV